jgi:hypothetical protein
MGRANQPIDQTSADPDKEPEDDEDDDGNNKFVKSETLAAHATHTDLLRLQGFLPRLAGLPYTHIISWRVSHVKVKWRDILTRQ